MTPSFAVAASKGLDPTVLAGLLQSFAAITAVIFGWLLSWAGERRSWSRRKVEQLRERQLETLSGVALDFKRTLEVARRVSSRLADLHQVTSSHGDRESGALIASEIRGKLHACGSELAELKDSVETQEMALRLIGFRGEGLADLGLAIEALSRVIECILTFSPGGDDGTIADGDLRTAIEGLRGTVNRFVDLGVRGLSG